MNSFGSSFSKVITKARDSPSVFIQKKALQPIVQVRGARRIYGLPGAGFRGPFSWDLDYFQWHLESSYKWFKPGFKEVAIFLGTLTVVYGGTAMLVNQGKANHETTNEINRVSVTAKVGEIQAGKRMDW